jgi:hypothetical protein
VAVEKRQYPRVKIFWPVTLVTESGIISGRTENLSLVGTLIRCSKIPELVCRFRLVFRPAERQLLIVTAEKVWSSTIVSNNSMSHVMGVRFTYIPDYERRLFANMINHHVDFKNNLPFKG